MKYAAFLLQLLCACMVVIVTAMYFVVRTYSEAARAENPARELTEGLTGLTLTGAASILAIAGVLGLAARPTPFFERMSIASIVMGIGIGVGLLATRLLIA